MIYAVYIIALNLGFVAFALSTEIDTGSPIDQPPNPARMHFAARLAGVCALVLTVYGFWQLTWYLPLLAWLLAASTAGSIVTRARRSVRAPGIVTALAAASVLLTLLLFQLMP